VPVDKVDSKAADKSEENATADKSSEKDDKEATDLDKEEAKLKK
jgi:hypothetical protein